MSKFYILPPCIPLSEAPEHQASDQFIHAYTAYMFARNAKNAEMALELADILLANVHPVLLAMETKIAKGEKP